MEVSNFWETYPELAGRYKAMKARCLKSYHPSYQEYGGRGIKICDRWLEKGQGYKNYYEDIVSVIGLPPSNKHQLDRINNDGNYEISNMRWATPRENLLNRRYLKPSNTGYKGVAWDEKRGRYRCAISYMNRSYFIGSFFTEDEACLQYEYHYKVLNTPSMELNKYERKFKSILTSKIMLKHEKAVAKLRQLA